MSRFGLTAHTPPQKIVIDALNLVSRFVPCDEVEFKHAHTDVLLAEARHRLADFAGALKRAGIETFFVFDNGQTSEEANTKWLERRQREVETASRTLPSNADIFLWAMLEDLGFVVYSPEGIDGDDAVALLAVKLGASILSRDQDFLRYGLEQGRVLCDFAIRNGAIRFCERTGVSRAEGRNLARLVYDLAAWKLPASSLLRNAEAGKLRRGNPDAHTKASGNLHAWARPLRAALYARHDLQDVLEVLPSWVDGTFAMLETTVPPDGSLDALLDEPQAMYEWILKVCGGGDERRRHAAAIIAAEIHVLAVPSAGHSDAKRMRDAYATLIPTLERAGPLRDWCVGGRCTGLFKPPRCKGDGRCFPMHLESAVYRKKPPLCEKCIQHLMALSQAKAARQNRNHDHNLGGFARMRI